jgi:hypothetical protein
LAYIAVDTFPLLVHDRRLKGIFLTPHLSSLNKSKRWHILLQVFLKKSIFKVNCWRKRNFYLWIHLRWKKVESCINKLLHVLCSFQCSYQSTTGIYNKTLHGEKSDTWKEPREMWVGWFRFLMVFTLKLRDSAEWEGNKGGHPQGWVCSSQIALYTFICFILCHSFYRRRVSGLDNKSKNTIGSRK